MARDERWGLGGLAQVKSAPPSAAALSPGLSFPSCFLSDSEDWRPLSLQIGWRRFALSLLSR